MPAMYQFLPSPCRPDWRIAMYLLEKQFAVAHLRCPECGTFITDPAPKQIYCSQLCKGRAAIAIAKNRR